MVSEKFGKEHQHILRDIRELVKGISKIGDTPMFLETTYIHQQNNQEYPMFIMNRDGFTLLSMGFTGDKALQLKLDYINAFNSMEQALQSSFKVPTSFREALLLAAEQQEVIEKQQLQLTEQAPKVEFFDAVTDSKDAFDMGTVAKVLNMGIGRNRLFEILRDEKVLMGNNQPYQSTLDKGWMRVIESKFTKPNGDICINFKTIVYQKGIHAIRKIISGKYNIQLLNYNNMKVEITVPKVVDIMYLSVDAGVRHWNDSDINGEPDQKVKKLVPILD